MRKIFLVGIGILGVSIVSRGLDSPLAHSPWAIPIPETTCRRQRCAMICERLHCTFIGILATFVDSIVVAESAGYWLHRFLHSNKFPVLSRSHLIPSFSDLWSSIAHARE